MNTIPESYSKNGWGYKLITRDGDYAIYSQGGDVAYELVKVRVRKDASFTALNKDTGESVERVIIAGEYLPSTEEWGRYGWTYKRYDNAVAAMQDKQRADREAELKPIRGGRKNGKI